MYLRAETFFKGLNLYSLFPQKQPLQNIIKSDTNKPERF